MEIKITRSEKRKRTISAMIRDGVMYVNALAGVSDKHLQDIVDKFKLRFKKKQLKRELNKTHNLLKYYKD